MSDPYDKILQLAQDYHVRKRLDGLVHEAAAREAARVNGKGAKAQLRFLESCGWDDEEVLRHLEEAKNA